MKKSTLLVVVILVLIAFAGILANRPMTENEYKEQRFEECINNFPSDFVCDSCWNAIYLK